MAVPTFALPSHTPLCQKFPPQAAPRPEPEVPCANCIPTSSGLINYIDTKATCSHPKYLPVRDFAVGANLSEAPSPPRTPYPPTLSHCIRVYRILIHTGKGGRGGGGGELTGEKVRGATVLKAGSKIPT